MRHYLFFLLFLIGFPSISQNSLLIPGNEFAKVLKTNNGEFISVFLVDSTLIVTRSDSGGNVVWKKEIDSYNNSFPDCIPFEDLNKILLYNYMHAAGNEYPKFHQFILIDYDGNIIKNIEDTIVRTFNFLEKGIDEETFYIFQNRKESPFGIEAIKFNLNLDTLLHVPEGIIPGHGLIHPLPVVLPGENFFVFNNGSSSFYAYKYNFYGDSLMSALCTGSYSNIYRKLINDKIYLFGVNQSSKIIKLSNIDTMGNCLNNEARILTLTFNDVIYQFRHKLTKLTNDEVYVSMESSSDLSPYKFALKILDYEFNLKCSGIVETDKIFQIGNNVYLYKPNNSHVIPYMQLEKVDCGIILNNKENVINEFTVDIFPNPSDDIINIKTNLISEYKIEVFDFTSKLILTMDNQQNNELRIDLKNSPEGIYLLKIMDVSGNVITRKIIKR
jgi:hypothetical protein